MQPLSLPVPLSQTRIHLYAKNVDMRKSFDGLHAIIQSEFQRDVRLGDLFLFLNRRRDRLKLMYWDRDGLAIWMKRLERGTFQRPLPSPGATHVEMDATDLTLLLSGMGRKAWLFVCSVAGGEQSAKMMTLVSSARRHDLDVWVYVKDVLDQLLAGLTDYQSLLPDVWKRRHPEAVRVYRVEERRDKAERKQLNAARRRLAARDRR